MPIMKYTSIRNVWREPLNVLPSHVIKSVVMQKVLSEDKDYWRRNQNLEENFRECFAELVESVERGFVRDVVWGVNILEVKLKNPRTMRYLAESLVSLMTVLDRSGIDAAFEENQKFSSRSCLRCDPYHDMGKSPRRHMLEDHKWSKYTSYQAATCAEVDDMWQMLRELNQLSTRERVYAFTEKEVLCTHCLQMLDSKCDLIRHIHIHHRKFRPAAEMALKDAGHSVLR
jgi:hypothetical protein